MNHPRTPAFCFGFFPWDGKRLVLATSLFAVAQLSDFPSLQFLQVGVRRDQRWRTTPKKTTQNKKT